MNSLDRLVAAWNLHLEHTGRSGSIVKIENGKVHVVLNKCGCPFIQRNILKLTPEHCLCSKRWLELVFKKLNFNAEVEVRKTIGFGDDVCEFYIYAHPHPHTRHHDSLCSYCASRNYR